MDPEPRSVLQSKGSRCYLDDDSQPEEMAVSNRSEGGRGNRSRKSRGRGLRNKSGCLICRRRHIKCDEDKPSCGECSKKKLVCVYGQSNALPGSTSNTSIDSILQQSTLESPGVALDSRNSPEAEGDSYSPQADPTWHSLLPNDEEDTPTNAPTDDLLRQTEIVSPEATQLHEQPRSTTAAHDIATSSLSSPENLVAGSTSSGATIENATARWFRLLAGDAAFEDHDFPDFNFDSTGFDGFGSSTLQPSTETPFGIAQNNRPYHQQQNEEKAPQTTNAFLLERSGGLDGGQLLEKEIWQSQARIGLLPHEHLIFQEFVQNISQWIDFFDPRRPFSTLVPHLALRNPGLMNAILALSARYQSSSSYLSGVGSPDPNDAIQYYYKTLHYIQKAMQYDTYKTSLELLSTSLIVSMYEMLDGSSKDWERHLKGVFWIQRSQVIHGDSNGLRQAVWWAWLCQDVWAAFREKRKPFTFWRPTRTFDTLEPYELAARSVYLMAQVVGYCSKEEKEESMDDLASRISKADDLLADLEDWKNHLTVEFEPLPMESNPSKDTCEPIWIHPPAFAVALQVYYTSKILLFLHRPLQGGLESYLEQQKSIKKCIKMVCGIAMTLSDHASSVLSSQCIFIAGITIQDTTRQNLVLKLLESCRQRSGWPVQSLGDELMSMWEMSDR